MKKKLLLLFIGLCACILSQAQIEYGFLSGKNFSGHGGSAMFNISSPISDADYFTAELGAGIFSNGDNNVVVVPILAGYRYTVDRSGMGLYVEPRIGYSIGGTDIEKLDATGQPVYDYNANKWVDIKASGVTAGANIGYLFKPSEGRFRVQWNICLRYDHTFSELASNMITLRVTHTFSFRRRSDY